MDFKLVVVAGDEEASEVKLRLPAILGRGREATLTVPHPLVSRQHCEIFEKGGQLVVRDLGSLNGTFVGDERISEAVLRDGELLTVGTVTFRAVYCDDPNLSAPARSGSETTVPADRPDASDGPVVGPPAGLADEGETERVQSPTSDGEEDDAEFERFLQSVDVEEGSVAEEVSDIGEPPAKPADSAEVEPRDEAEPVENVATVDKPERAEDAELAEEVEVAEPAEEFEEILELEEAEVDDHPVVAPQTPASVVEAEGKREAQVAEESPAEVEQVQDAEAAEEIEELAMPAPAEPAAASAAPGGDVKKPKSAAKPVDSDEDELQSFLRQLDI